MLTTQVGSDGHIILPPEVAIALGIKSNDTLYCEVTSTAIILRPMKPASETKRTDDFMKYAGIAKGLWGDSSEDIDKFIRDERDSWEK